MDTEFANILSQMGDEAQTAADLADTHLEEAQARYLEQVGGRPISDIRPPLVVPIALDDDLAATFGTHI